MQCQCPTPFIISSRTVPVPLLQLDGRVKKKSCESMIMRLACSFLAVCPRGVLFYRPSPTTKSARQWMREWSGDTAEEMVSQSEV